MRIKKIYTSSPLLRGADFDATKSIFVFSENHILMEMMRCMIGEENIRIADNGVDDVKEDDIAFMNSVMFEIDGEIVELVSVLSNNQNFEIIMKADECSNEKKRSILESLSKKASDEKNTFTHINKYCSNDDLLSESERTLQNLEAFIKNAEEEGKKGDTRPIYVYHAFERLDEATNIAPLIKSLVSLGRQIFVCVPKSYPIEKFNTKNVQFI